MNLRQAGKEVNLVLNTLAGNTWATLSVCLGHGGPSQHTNSRKHEVPEMVQHSKHAVKYEGVQEEAHFATAEATAIATAKFEKVETYAEKVSAGVKTAEASRAGVSGRTTSALTTRATFTRAAEAFSFRPRLI